MKVLIITLILLLLPYDVQAKKCDFQEDFFTPVPAKKTGEWTVATQNMWRLFDDLKDGRAAAVSSQTYQMRLQKMSQQIRLVLNEPDILAMQEVENIKVLEDLAKQLKIDAAKVKYKSYLIPGNDMSGINVGFLVNDAIKVKSVSALLTDERLANSVLFDRPPLMLTLLKKKQEINIINVHLKSLRTNDNFKSEEDVRLKRMAQAQALKAWLQKFIENNKKTKLMVLGDFNATKSGVGGVDVLKEIMSVGLSDALSLLPEEQQYTYVYKCQKEDLDHIFLSTSLQNRVTNVAIGRGNANSPYRYKKKVATPMKSSDHDGIVLYLK